MGIYKFGNNTYPRRIGHRENLGHIFQGKSAPYGPANTVFVLTKIHSFFNHALQYYQMQENTIRIY
jgi:hypothetical protein